MVRGSARGSGGTLYPNRIFAIRGNAGANPIADARGSSTHALHWHAPQARTSGVSRFRLGSARGKRKPPGTLPLSRGRVARYNFLGSLDLLSENLNFLK